jgi:hypothetical protein
MGSQNLTDNAESVFADLNQWAVSVGSYPNMTADQIAVEMLYRGRSICESQVVRLRDAGFEVIPDRGEGPVHALVLLPEPPSENLWERLRACFQKTSSQPRIRTDRRPLMFIRPKVTIRIDLNSLRGDRIVTPRSAQVSPLLINSQQLLPGEFVRAVEEEGDSYVGVVEAVDGDMVRLRLLLDTWMPDLHLGKGPAFVVHQIGPSYPHEAPHTRTVPSDLRLPA